jgi:hypothetical protein
MMSVEAKYSQDATGFYKITFHSPLKIRDSTFPPIIDVVIFKEPQ